MKAPLTAYVGEDGKVHGCVIKPFLWLNTQKHAEGGKDVLMSEGRSTALGFHTEFLFVQDGASLQE